VEHSHQGSCFLDQSCLLDSWFLPHLCNFRIKRLGASYRSRLAESALLWKNPTAEREPARANVSAWALAGRVRRELPDLPDRQLILKARGPAVNLPDGPLERGVWGNTV
jgi:hypothetical protein